MLFLQGFLVAAVSDNKSQFAWTELHENEDIIPGFFFFKGF